MPVARSIVGYVYHITYLHFWQVLLQPEAHLNFSIWEQNSFRRV